MQEFIANGRVASIPDDAVGRTANGHVSFKFVICSVDSSLLDEQRKPILVFSRSSSMVNKQRSWQQRLIQKCHLLLVKGEIIQRPYTNNQGQRRSFQYLSPSQQGRITFLESKEAANKRKEGNRELSQSVDNISAYLEPIDAEEPF